MNTRYLVTLENEKRFIEHKFNQDRVVASAETKWFPLNSQSRSDYVRLITRTRMDLEDDYWGFQSEGDKGFFTELKPTRNLPYSNKFQNAITYEVSLEQRFYYRKVYTSLDFLSEIGGIFSALSRICLVLITGLNYFGSFQFLMGDNFYSRRLRQRNKFVSAERKIVVPTHRGEEEMDLKNDV